MANNNKPEILIILDPNSDNPLYVQIYERIKQAIFSNELQEGSKLPSIRRISKELRVSHTTVEQAYSQLTIEGLVINVPRSGFVVTHVDPDFMDLAVSFTNPSLDEIKKKRSTDAFYAENRMGSKIKYDFSYANLQSDSFPVSVWGKLITEVLYSNTIPEMSRYSYTDKPSSLCIELEKYLARTRGIHCHPEQVLLQAGTDGAISTIFQLFDRDNDVIGMEEPGYTTVVEVAKRHGFKVVPIPTDKGDAAFLDEVERLSPKLLFTTPSHQFPTGKLLTLDARIQLLKWAENNDSFIIEDDSCNEYRYRSMPLRALQSLDFYGRVIYLCNVSKALSPALRIAYMVLPPTLLECYWDLFNHVHPPVSWLDQEVLARFISRGHWDSLIRKISKGNQKRHDVLLRSLRDEFGNMIELSGIDTGMHLYATINNGMSQTELLKSALDHDVKVYGTSRMWFENPAPPNKIMIGFSAIDLDDIEPGVKALKSAWG